MYMSHEAAALEESRLSCGMLYMKRIRPPILAHNLPLRGKTKFSASTRGSSFIKFEKSKKAKKKILFFSHPCWGGYLYMYVYDMLHKRTTLLYSSLTRSLLYLRIHVCTYLSCRIHAFTCAH